MPRGEMQEQHYNPVPLDFVILEALPDQGIIGGVHWAGRPAKYLAQSINADLTEGVKVSPNYVTARLRSMHVAGYVQLFGGGPRNVWARTPEGVKHLANKEAILGV